MGYILVFLALCLVVPLVLMLGRRTPAGGGGVRRTSRGITVDSPSSDQPTPGASESPEQASPEAEKRIPPG